MKLHSTFLMVTLVLLMTACSTVRVSTQDPHNQLLESRSNIITNGKLSSNSLGLLHISGLDEKDCIKNFSQCLNQLEDYQFDQVTPRQLAQHAELEYAKAKNIVESKFCKKQADVCHTQYYSHLFESIKYSYSYLFYNNINHLNSKSNMPSELDIQTLDIYNSASRKIIDKLYKKTQTDTKSITLDVNSNLNVLDQVALIKTNLSNNQVKFFFPNTRTFVNPGIGEKIENLIPTDSLKMSGLNSISKRAGFGLSYIAQQSERHISTIKNTLNDDEQAPSNLAIYPTGNLLLTAIIQPVGNTLEDILSNNEFELHFYDPYHTKEINILGSSYTIAGNFSASYALWLNENELNSISIINMLRKDQSIPKPRLYMLEPFDPNKRVIIMIHGLASSPSTWVNLTNDIFNDEKLRDNYQVWQIFYSTNLPIIENRFYINELIKKAYRKNNTKNTISGEQSVIIAHSMGSVISRMLLSEDNLISKLDTLTIDKSKTSNLLHQSMLNQYKAKEYHERLNLHPINQVNKAIFISAPFRGTNFADRWFTKALRDLIQLPLEFTKNLSPKEDVTADPVAALFLDNGASQLSDKSSFMELTKDINISSKVRYHTIMGQYKGILDVINSDSLEHKQSDGIVPYTSSHLEGADSETVLSGGHDIHTNPKTIVQLRKILHEHLDQDSVK